MSEEQQQQPKPVSIVLKCQYAPVDNEGNEGDPFGFDLTAECLVAHIPGIVRKLQQAGIKPAQTPYTWDASKAAQNPPQMAPQGAPAMQQAPAGTPPLCPVHGVQMAESKFGGWYCKSQVGVGPDGKRVYCQEKVSS